MAKFKVNKVWKNKYTGEIYSPDTVIEMTVKRANEAEKNLKEHGGGFFERVEETEAK